MKPDISQWRSSSTYDFLDDIDSPDIAWEWLRRHAKYQGDYRAVADAAVDDTPATVDLINNWGLCFPRPARPLGRRNAGILAARPRHRRSRPRRHAANPFRRT